MRSFRKNSTSMLTLSLRPVGTIAWLDGGQPSGQQVGLLGKLLCIGLIQRYPESAGAGLH